jgi:hypothetical protein
MYESAGAEMTRFFQVTITIIIALTSLSISASIGDTDVVFCEEIRSEAAVFCNSNKEKECYQSEVDRLVKEANTSDQSYDGEEVCAY